MKKIIKIWNGEILAEPLVVKAEIKNGKVIDWWWCEKANDWYAGTGIQDIDFDLQRRIAIIYLDEDPWIWKAKITEIEDIDYNNPFQC